MNITKHFTFRELVSTSYENVEAENIYYAVDNMKEVQALAEFAEEVRKVLGVPMIITSGVRCPRLNSFVKGSKTSDHVRCRAIDFITTKISVKKAFELLQKSKLKFKQLIYERNTWVHISMPEKNKREVLVYDGEKYKRV